MQTDAIRATGLGRHINSAPAPIPRYLQELLPVALQLSSLYQSPLVLLPTEVRRPARHPWAHLMAALVVAGAAKGLGALTVVHILLARGCCFVSFI